MEEDKEIIFGTCLLMCPEHEIKEREASKRLHYFERTVDTKNQRSRPKVDRNRAVKEFRRSAVGKSVADPSELRPLHILQKTVQYLINSIIPNNELQWSEVYNFVFDRLRSVRQDMVIQRIHGDDAIFILETTVRFLTYASYRLRSESKNKFDSHINDTHMQECLKKLIVNYSKCASDPCHQGEFVALYLIVNLGSMEALSLGLQLKSIIRCDPVFTAALSLSLAWWKGNYIRTLRYISQLPWLHLCAIYRHLELIRCTVLKVMSSAFKGKNLTYPVSCLAEMLLFDTEEDAMELCRASGLAIIDNQQISFAKSKFHDPLNQVPQSCQWIDKHFDGILLSELLEGRSSKSVEIVMPKGRTVEDS